MSPWYQNRGGHGGKYHPKRCIAVDRYGFDSVDDRDDCPDVDPLITCKLCENDVTPDIERLAPAARELSGQYTPEDFGDDKPWSTRHLDPIRTIDAVTEGRLQDEGFLEENAGAEVIKLRDWQRSRKEAADRSLFEWLLRDTIESHLVFYRDYKGFDEDEPFLEAILEQSGTSADGCAQNVAKTWRWLEGIGIPEQLETRQAGLGAFSGEVA